MRRVKLIKQAHSRAKQKPNNAFEAVLQRAKFLQKSEWYGTTILRCPPLREVVLERGHTHASYAAICRSLRRDCEDHLYGTGAKAPDAFLSLLCNSHATPSECILGVLRAKDLAALRVSCRSLRHLSIPKACLERMPFSGIHDLTVRDLLRQLQQEQTPRARNRCYSYHWHWNRRNEALDSEVKLRRPPEKQRPTQHSVNQLRRRYRQESPRRN